MCIFVTMPILQVLIFKQFIGFMLFVFSRVHLLALCIGFDYFMITLSMEYNSEICLTFAAPFADGRPADITASKAPRQGERQVREAAVPEVRQGDHLPGPHGQPQHRAQTDRHR